MLASLHNYYKQGTAKLIPELDSWFKNLDIKLNAVQKRYLKAAKIINSVQQKLIHVLNIIDIPYLAKQSQDDFYIYLNYFKYIKEQVEGLYNLHDSAHPTRNQYIKKIEHVCTEVTVPVFENDYLSIWPMGHSYPDWRYSVNPLYFHYHDSDLLTYNIFMDKIIFKTYEPNVAIFFIDIPSLCMKYFKWYIHTTGVKDIYSFITNEVWFGLIEQMRHIWVMRQHELSMLRVAGVDVSNYIESNAKHPLMTGARYVEIMNKLFNLYKEVSEGKILANTIFSSKLFNYDNNSTFRDLVNYNLSHLYIPEFSQYEWVRFLRDYPLLKYLVSVYLLRDRSPSFKMFKTNFEIRWNKLLSKAPWDNIKDIYLKEWFKKKIAALSSFI